MIFFVLLLGLSACAPEPAFPPVDLSGYALPKGFELEVVAAEPLLEAPVAMAFDTRGRIWVAEMRGYMTDLDNSGEQLPTGRISILGDDNGDGRMDRRQTFLDSLVLPRALALVYGGLLYAEPPNLWFVTIENDSPGARTLVDSAYATGGNVEHQANGLLPALDNWIYSANSALRYRRQNGRWLREKTHFRGQWGITQDALGRLLYNDNSNQLQGDWLPPNALLRNRFFEPGTGFAQQICTDQRVWPLQRSLVNRGYEPGMLDSAGRLQHVTSACGPLLYRGGQFPEEYRGNAFVCAPEVNLVKRNIFHAAQLRRSAHQAQPGREFLAATDPGFRPVNLNEGPDGCLYVVDMHRGIIQHKTYLTAYLHEQLLGQRFDTIRGQGRILRLRHKSPASPPPDVSRAKTTQWVGWLAHRNAWVRDQARCHLIEGADPSALPLLRRQAQAATRPETQLQALWALEGLDGLSAPFLLQVAGSAREPWVAMQALQLLERFARPDTAAAAALVFEKMSLRQDSVLDLALCLYAGPWGPPVFGLLGNVLHRYPADTLFHEALLSGLNGQEAPFLRHLQQHSRAGEFVFLKKMLTQTAAARRANRPAAWPQEPRAGRDQLTTGLALYQTYCGACHGPGGQGTPNLAPPLDGSEWVGGRPERLARIALYGLQGPLTVQGRRYTFNGAMPGLADNPDLTDADLAALLTYVRNAFSRKPLNFRAEQIGGWRRPGRAGSGALRAEEWEE